ncbi:MAG: hypothetical protein CMB31_05200 [Euryarchaeota archaeon]|nr:hypothetical protein [Euryarchaeota archaeon]
MCRSCNNSNFAFRTECNRCGKSRGDGGHRRSRDGERGNQRFRRDDRRSGGQRRSRDGERRNQRFRRDDRGGRDDSQGQSRDGDWVCKGCGNNNFSFRTECNRCGKSKTGGGSNPRKESRGNNRGERRQNSGSRFSRSNNRGNSRGSRGSNNFRDRNRR